MRKGGASLAVLIAFASFRGSALAQGPPSPRMSEVVFIGANHNLAFLHPAFSPAHIRALLSRIAPAALCLEVTADWPKKEGIPTFPQEQYAAFTWAERQGIPVYGVNWETPAARALPPIEKMDDSVALRDNGPGFDSFRDTYRATVQWTAGQAFGETADDIESFERRLPTVVTVWPQEDSAASIRDDRIAENIRAVLAKYPGKRVAVVFGSYHYLPFKRRLESTGVALVFPPLRYFPLEPKLIEDGWYSDDAVLLLGTNLDDWRSIAAPQSRNHQRTRELLDRLRRERPHASVTHYYEARWRMLFGDLNGSKPLLQKIADEPGASSLPYLSDTRWNWPPFRTFQQKARFYLAVADDLAGDHDAATREYRRLLMLPEDQLVVPALIRARRVDLRPYIESLIRLAYRGGEFEAYRAYLALGR